MTFRDFMERALYEPGRGYYEGPQSPWSEGADFVTAPQVDASVGIAVACLAQECDAALGAPQHFDLVEFGGGDGALMGDVCDALQRHAADLYQRLRVWSIEPGGASREQQQRRLAAHAGRVQWLCGIDELSLASIRGLVYSNELLDAFPVHRVVWRDDALWELFVDVDGGGFVERQMPPSTPELHDYLRFNDIALRQGQVAEICLAVRPWIEGVAARLDAGFVLTIDYGAETASLYGDSRMQGSLVCQHRYQLNAAPYERVGEQDITAHVDLGNLRRCAALYGLEDAGIASLAVFLLGFGAAAEIAAVGEGATPSSESVRRQLGLKHLLFTEIADAHRVMLLARNVAPMPFGLSRLG